jgi:predicted nucleotidyltransferase/DNA-binding HxlR family transcriptional regulator
MRTDKTLDVLLPKTRQAVLSTLLLHSQRSWYLHELAAHLRVRPSSLQRELSRLTDAGILTRRSHGNRVFYQVDESCPLVVDLRSLLAKTVGLVDVLRAALGPFQASIEYAFVYGSLARGEETSTSDIDLLIIGQLGLADVAPALRQAEKQLGRSVNPSVYTLSEFTQKMRANNHFLITVWGEKKLAVQGDLDELATIIGRPSGA